MPKKPINRIFIRMFFYGIVYGSLTSGFLFMALQLADTPNWSNSDLLSTFSFGLPVGAFFGSFAGILSGIAIEVSLPHHLTSNIIRAYRLPAGIVTICMCVLIFSPLFGGVMLFDSYAENNVALIFFLISIGIAVYASQRTVTKYLREIDVRKMKVK